MVEVAEDCVCFASAEPVFFGDGVVWAFAAEGLVAEDAAEDAFDEDALQGFFFLFGDGALFDVALPVV